MDVVAERLVPMCNAGKVRRLGSTMIEQSMISGNTARIAGLLALGNQVSTNSSACSTGNEAVVDGLLRIREGRAKRMLAGGSEGSLEVFLGSGGRDQGPSRACSTTRPRRRRAR